MNPSDDNLRHLVFPDLPDPETLSGVEARFEKRFIKEQRKKRLKISSAVTTALILFMFITANTDTAWAENLKKIPVLKELLSSMSFVNRHEDQIEELGLVSDNGDHQLYLQYAISDDKRIQLYLQFPDYITLEGYDVLEVEILKVYDLNTGEDFTTSFMNPSQAYAEYFDHNYVHLIGMLPAGLDIHYPDEVGMTFSATISRRDFTSTQGMKLKSTEDLGEFSFETTLQKMSKTKNNQINQRVTLAGNDLDIISIERSPLSTSLIISEVPDNKDRISSLEGMLIDGETGAVITDDLSSLSYDKNFHIHSVYLDPSKLNPEAHPVELLITGVGLMDKKTEFITIDFDKKTMSPLMEGMELTMASVGKQSLLTFAIEPDPSGVMNTPFHHWYETEEGERKLMPMGSYSGGIPGERYTISYVFDEEIHGTITLRRHIVHNSHFVPLTEPERILIDMPEVFDPIP